MASKPKVGGAKKRPAKASAKAKEKSQRERFIEAARKAGVDETGREFAKTISTLVPPRGLPRPPRA
jgi:hypothetical protein